MAKDAKIPHKATDSDSPNFASLGIQNAPSEDSDQTQSDQNLHWVHFGWPRMQSFRLHKRADWSKSSLGAHVRRYITDLTPHKYR